MSVLRDTMAYMSGRQLLGIEDVRSALIKDDDGLCTLNAHNRKILARFGAQLMAVPIAVPARHVETGEPVGYDPRNHTGRMALRKN